MCIHIDDKRIVNYVINPHKRDDSTTNRKQQQANEHTKLCLRKKPHDIGTFGLEEYTGSVQSAKYTNKDDDDRFAQEENAL